MTSEFIVADAEDAAIDLSEYTSYCDRADSGINTAALILDSALLAPLQQPSWENSEFSVSRYFWNSIYFID